MQKIEPRTLSGFMELLPDEQILFNQMIDTIRQSYEKFGFLPLDTPIIESAPVLLAKAGGETEKQIYRFEKGDNDLALRFDLTVPLAKYISIHQNDIAFPFRRYQIGKVYRGERPQKGRFREFYQCDIDIIGDGELSILNDAEIPAIIYNTFLKLGFSDFTIKINNRKILNGLFEALELQDISVEIMRIIDKIDKIGKTAVIEEMSKLGIQKEKIQKVVSFIEISGDTNSRLKQLRELNIKNKLFEEGENELQQVVEGVRIFGVPEQYFIIDFNIARGLDYYTGTVYETFLNNYRQLGSICSGGRYDNLTQYYTESKLPGVGISIGITRLFYQLNELKLIHSNKKSIADVLVISMTDDITPCIKVANELRNANINTQIYTDNKKIKTKFKYADKLQIPYVIVLGEEEIKNNVVTLKNMESGEQETMELQNAINKILEN